MPVVGLALWDEFVDALTKHPPESRTVHLSFNVRSRNGSGVSMYARYATSDGFVECLETLHQLPDARDLPSRMQALFERRKKELERFGFRVESGRRRIEEARDA